MTKGAQAIEIVRNELRSRRDVYNEYGNIYENSEGVYITVDRAKGQMEITVKQDGNIIVVVRDSNLSGVTTIKDYESYSCNNSDRKGQLRAIYGSNEWDDFKADYAVL